MLKGAKFFLGVFLLFAFCAQGEESSSQRNPSNTPTFSNWKDEVFYINQQIRELKNKKLGYEGRALRQENYAQRLQFSPGELQEAKRYWKLAEKNRKIAEEIQKEIDRLEARKEELVKLHQGSRVSLFL